MMKNFILLFSMFLSFYSFGQQEDCPEKVSQNLFAGFITVDIECECTETFNICRRTDGDADPNLTDNLYGFKTKLVKPTKSIIF